MARQRRLHSTGGTPIEEAPLWLLAIATVIFWLVTFPALVGLLAGWGYWRGEKLQAALASLAIAALVITGLATRKAWKRPTAKDLRDRRPFFARFSTWLMTIVFLPNILFGVLVLTHEGPPIGYEQALLLGLLVSTVQAVLGLLDRWQRRRRGEPQSR